MKTTLPSAAEAAIYSGVHRMRGFRAIAATVMARYARDMADGWLPDSEAWAHLQKIAARWHLGDAFNAMLAGYRQDKL